MATYTPVLYGSKLSQSKKPAGGGTKTLVTGSGKPAATSSLASLLSQRDQLRMLVNDQSGTGMSRLLARRQLAALEEQINTAGAARPAPGGARQPFDENKNLPGVQAMPTVTAGTGAVASQPAADTTTAVAATTPAEDEATKLKLAEEQRQRDIEKAKADELARQDEIRKRRGFGFNSFLTGGLSGRPTSLASLLGV